MLDEERADDEGLGAPEREFNNPHTERTGASVSDLARAPGIIHITRTHPLRALTHCDDLLPSRRREHLEPAAIVHGAHMTKVLCNHAFVGQCPVGDQLEGSLRR